MKNFKLEKRRLLQSFIVIMFLVLNFYGYASTPIDFGPNHEGMDYPGTQNTDINIINPDKINSSSHNNDSDNSTSSNSSTPTKNEQLLSSVSTHSYMLYIQETNDEKEKIPEKTEETVTEIVTVEEESKQAVEESKNKSQNKKEENVSNTEKETNKIKEDTGGDPVKLSSGCYEQSEIDICQGNILPLEVSRHYSSANKIISSFGLGWSTNLDQRIILGTRPDAEVLVAKARDHLETIQVSIAQLEEIIIRAYHTSSVDSAQKDLLTTIEHCHANLKKAESLCNNLAQLEKESRGYSAESEIKKVHSKALDYKNSLIKKIADLENALERLKGELAKLEELKVQKRLAKEELEKEEGLLQITLLRRKKNALAMFKGMGKEHEETGLDTLTYFDEDGYPHLMYEDPQLKGKWKTKEISSYTECCETDQGYILKEKDGSQKHFDSNGFLIRITDRYSNYIIINRDSREKIKSLENSFGESFSISYEDDFIQIIQNMRDPTEKISYSYNGNLLQSIKDAEGDRVNLQYDQNGNLTKLQKCDGSFISYSYDFINARGQQLASSTTDEEGFFEYFDYMENQTVYTDHDGNKSLYFFDDKGRTIKEVHADGSTITREYDSKGNLTSINENGRIISYSYDDKGNKVSAAYQDGSREYWTYDSFCQVISYKDRDGLFYEYIRDKDGNLTNYKINGKSILTQLYNSKGQLQSQTIYGGSNVTTSYEYDSWGNLTGKNTGGLKTEYKYDSRNRLTKTFFTGRLISQYTYDKRNVIEKSFKGLETTYITNGRKDLVQVLQKDTVTGLTHKTRIEYDRRHLPLKVFIGDDKSENLLYSYLYTKEGRVCAQIAHGEESWIILYEYKNGSIKQVKEFMVREPFDTGRPVNEGYLQELMEAAGQDIFVQEYDYSLLPYNERLLAVTDGLGHQSFFYYDRYGKLINQTDANGEKREKTYSKAGLLIGEQSSYGGWYDYGYTDGFISSSRERQGNPVTREYFPNGDIKSCTDSYGQKTIYNYDRLGRISSRQSQSYNIWYEYNDFGLITKEIIGNTSSPANADYLVTLEYSEDQRRILICQGGKYKNTKELDAFGNVIRETDGNGNTRRYEYNCLNQLVKAYDAYENCWTYTYNALGKIKSQTGPDGAKTEYVYNYMGLLQKITDDCGNFYSAIYDKAGRLIKEKTRGDSQKAYDYDAAGRLIKILNGDEILQSYEYGKNSRNIVVKDGNANDYLYTYDAFGRLINEKNRLGFIQDFVYDQAGKLKNQKNFDGTTSTINYSKDRTIRTEVYSDGSQNQFTYNAIGNIVEASNAYGKTIYKYDQAGLLIYQKDQSTGEEIYFEYDSAGNRIRLYSSNRDTSYVYGKNNELKEIFDNKQRMSVKLEYNKNGSEILRKFGNGTRQATLYDKAGRVTAKIHKTDQGDLLWSEAYIYDTDGKRRATADNKGAITLYEYNKQGQLSAVWYPYTQETINTLKAQAEENGLATNTQAGENKYLPADVREQLLPLMNSIQYGLANKVSNLQIFIKEAYSYDKTGNRASKTTKYGTIEYKYDQENRLLSTGSKGQAYVNYTYDNLGNLLSQTSNFKTVKYAYNAQNRLIYCEETDKASKNYAQTCYAYDAFGRRILVQDKNQAALRTLYDGFTFDLIKQSPTFANGLFTDSNANGINLGQSGKANGDRYRYLEDDNQDNNRYIYLEQENYKSTSDRYYGERTQLTVNGSLAAQSSLEGLQYFSTDLQGSIRTTSSSQGYQLDNYTYDAFGNLLQGHFHGSSDHGYLGKEEDPTSNLYNYGYRDYSPQQARFTTPDPIRDGHNWFTYVNNDPINFVDLWGLEQTKYQQEITKALSEQALYDIDLQNYIKENTVIEVTRSELDNGNNGTYFQSTVSIKVGNLVLNESKIQSTPDHPKLNNGDPQYDGLTLAPGEYIGTLINKSHSYSKAISITGNGVTRSDAVLFHPNAMTALGSRESYGQGNLKGHPLSLACQIQELESHEEMTDILESLGFKFGNGQNCGEWVDGDKIKIVIKDKCSK